MASATEARHLEIRLLGEPELVRNGQIAALPASKKTRALLGYLVATGRPQRRERLCELLWDGPDDPRAGLRWSLAKLRPLVEGAGVTRLVADRERVGFESHGADVDLFEVSTLDRTALGSVPVARLTRALSRFRGPFLEGLELSSCPSFHAWCVAEREKLAALQVALLTTLIDRERSDPVRAVRHARALIELDPLAEAPRRLLLDLLAERGEGRRALEEYDDYARTLERELGTKPSFELSKRRVEIASRLSEPAPAPAPRISEPAPASVRTFVGRRRERETLERLVEQAGRGTPVVLVLGEPGIGKTHLLEELSRFVEGRGGVALSGRAFEAELVRPYGAFIDALRSAGPAVGAQPEPGSLLPAPFSVPATDRTRLYDAVSGFLLGIADKRAPLLLVLDDLHWFDEASSELLHYLARELRARPVVFAASLRKAELADNPAAQRLVRALNRERLATSLELGPLGEDELRALVTASGEPAPSPALARVLAESEGNPLFVLEALRAQQAGSDDLVGSLSRWIGERFDRLQDADRALLYWAGALGRSFDVAVLARVTALPVPELLSSLERLERHGILRTRDAGYDFAHDLFRQAAYRQMSGPRQRLVHGQIARALAEAPDAEGALWSDVAHHAALAGEVLLAARACVSAARRCLRLFAYHEARELTARGMQLVPSLAEAERPAIEVELLAVQVLVAPSAELGVSNAELDAPIAAVAARARELGLPAVEARAFFLRSLLQFRAGDSDAALASSIARIEAARRAGPLDLAAELAGAARCYLLVEKNLDGAEQLLVQAREILGADSEQIDVVWGEGLLAHVRGDLARAVERMDRTLSLARRQQAHWEECECLLALSFIDFDRGEYGRVLGHAAELGWVAAKLEDPGAYAPMAVTLETLVSLARDPCAPGERFEKALAGLRDAGANRLLSLVLNRAAELLRAEPERAERHAEQALEAAECVERVSEIAIARTLLAELALDRGEKDAARRHLEAVGPLALGPDLSARSAGAVARLKARFTSA